MTAEYFLSKFILISVVCLSFLTETRHGGADNMGATYNNPKQSKCLLNNQNMTHLKQCAFQTCYDGGVFLVHM